MYCAQLAEAIPVEGSGTTLPLDLHRIAARCRNSYFAPKRFSAVQLAYNEPRCRVLVFRKSRLPVPLYTNHTTDMILCVFRYRTNGWNWYALAPPPPRHFKLS